MIVYSETKEQFCIDVYQNAIQDKILREMQRKLSRSVAANEVSAWRSSLGYMERVLNGIPNDAGVSIEYIIPLTNKRVDFILTGQAEDGTDRVVIVELKQWSKVEVTSKDAIVRTLVGGTDREQSHPSYQAWTYAALIQDYNETVRDEGIRLFPCAYLHNLSSPDAVNDPSYSAHIAKAPVFISSEVENLSQFLANHIRHGDQRTIMFRIENGKIRPSKELAESLLAMLRGNTEFLMIDDQKVVYEQAIDMAQRGAHEKSVLVVEGGPGTGKSVVSINLLVELTKRGLVTQYVSKNAAPRAVYEAKLKGSFKKTEISNLFKGSASYTDIEPHTFDALLVDEAHRLVYRSQYSKNGVNQICDLIRTSKTTVFFLDENQRISFDDIGTKEEIISQARAFGIEPEITRLESQFRCNGSDGYLAWTDDALGVRQTANPTLEGIDYDFRVFDNPGELHNAIRKKNETNNKARVVAGYCWDWVSKKEPSLFDINIGEYRARWNLDKDGSLWLVAPNSIEEVGCIHTCQGLELEYVGVIIGPDFVVRDGKIVTSAENRSAMDRTIRGYKKMSKESPDEAAQKADQIIKNTYRTLMTRGIKGCYIYCTDHETNEYFKNRMGRAADIEVEHVTALEPASLPFEIVENEERNDPRSIPIYDLKAAAGAFSNFQAPEELGRAVLPDHLRMQDGLFVCQVMGESMNKRIPNGAWCIFKVHPTGSKQGKIVLAQHRDIEDEEHGGQYTVKRYFSEKVQMEVGSEVLINNIELRPESYEGRFETITITEQDDDSTLILAELIAVL